MLRKPATKVSALKVLIQGRDDQPGYDLALDMASELVGDGRIAVVSCGVGVSGLAREFEFDEVVDDRGCPIRSLGLLAEEINDLPHDVKAVVILDASQVYRATRCSTRNEQDRRNLGPGDWDDIAESAAAMIEACHRRGVHQVWVAPSSQARMLNIDGDEVISNRWTPKCWGDLPRSVHVWLDLDDRGGCLVKRDETTLLGRGQRVDASGESLASTLSEFLGAPPRPSTSTLGETIHAELEARVRRAKSVRLIEEEFGQMAWWGRWQGPDALAAIRSRWWTRRGDVDPQTASRVDASLASAHEMVERLWRPMRARERTMELSPLGDGGVFDMYGPDPAQCPATGDGLDVEQAFADNGRAAHGGQRLAESLPVDELPGWIAALARSAGIFSQSAFSVVCANTLDRGSAVHAEQQNHHCQAYCKLAKGQPAWSSYSENDMRNLLAWVYTISERLHALHAPAPEPPLTVRTIAVERAPRAGSEPVAAAAVHVPFVPALELPSVEAFEAHSREDQTTYLRAVLTARHKWDDLAGLFVAAGVDAPAKRPRSAPNWTDEQRRAVWACLIGEQT